MSFPSLKLLSSMATREILAELSVTYTREHGQAINAEASGGVNIAKRVQAGEVADIVVLAGDAIDKLIAADKLVVDSRTDLMKSAVAIAVPHGTPALDISSEQAVKQAVLNAKSLSYSTGPSGVYLEQLFQRWGILPEVKSRVVVPPSGIPVGSLIAKGEVELGFQQFTELMGIAGITILGPLPPAIQTITTFTAAVTKSSQQSEAARRVLKFMSAPVNKAVMQKYGMESAN